MHAKKNLLNLEDESDFDSNASTEKADSINIEDIELMGITAPKQKNEAEKVLRALDQQLVLRPEQIKRRQQKKFKKADRLREIA